MHSATCDGFDIPMTRLTLGEDDARAARAEMASSRCRLIEKPRGG